MFPWLIPLSLPKHFEPEISKGLRFIGRNKKKTVSLRGPWAFGALSRCSWVRDREKYNFFLDFFPWFVSWIAESLLLSRAHHCSHPPYRWLSYTPEHMPWVMAYDWTAILISSSFSAVILEGRKVVPLQNAQSTLYSWQFRRSYLETPKARLSTPASPLLPSPPFLTPTSPIVPKRSSPNNNS